jgi:linoleoyl-CoA desaturase
MKFIEKKHLKFQSKDSPDHIFKQIKAKVDSYLAKNKLHKYGNILIWLKFFVLVVFLGCAYYSLLHSSSFIQLVISYILFGWIFLVIGINIGHDAAHGCVSGNKKLDNFIFQMIFGLQGLSGYIWQIRHNNSHHIFPNVEGSDTDMEITKMILLNSKQKIYSFHKYQHLYAPFLYMFFSLGWIFYDDFILFFKKEQANLKFGKIPVIEWLKLFLIKITYLFTFLAIPFFSNSFSALAILAAFVIMHFTVSLFLTFTFFISHHVMEVAYTKLEENSELVTDSWASHQITTTIDFNPESRIANFLFGGFNLHIAHHIFPDVSHIYYPAITRIIRETLDENHVSWYKSFTFFRGISSHLKHLKKMAREIISEKELSLS